MSPKPVDMTGRVFGKLTVLGPTEGKRAPCRCECGRSIQVLVSNLRSGNTRSCGCLRMRLLRDGIAKKHGGWGTRAYSSWTSLMDRCLNPNNPAFARYGGRGIGVSYRWQRFENFLEDMGERPEGTSIDRIDNDRGYEPGNCRWATPAEQRRNQRTTKLRESDLDLIRFARAAGCTHAEIAAVFGVSDGAIAHVLNGWSWKPVANR
jgi:hypothetical protein